MKGRAVITVRFLYEWVTILFLWRFIKKRWRGLLISPFIMMAILWGADKLFPLPLPNDDVARVVLSSDGTPLWRFADADGVWRYPISIDQVSPYYLEALINYEDRWFYDHPGVNPVALGRAMWQNIKSGKVISGGSTLTMQVARIIDPHPRTYLGKLQQLFRTMQLEWHLSKDEILTIYLNRAPYGGTIEGIAAASWSYLGKPPSQLTRSEAALLAVLPQAPSRLRPDRYPKIAEMARNKVLDRLAQYHVWPKNIIEETKQEGIFLTERQQPQIAPLLARRLYNTNKIAVIKSTIDVSLQRLLEDLLKNWQVRLPEYSSAAILVVDHQTMEVKAYLGSIDIQDEKRFGHVDMVSAIRSPGSTLKPFIYAMAMDAGLIHSESLLQDVPRRYGNYKPGNFSAGFIGPVAASDALTMSLNLPAVQLMEAYGPKRFVGELKSAGVPLFFPTATSPNLAVILGGVGAKLEDLLVGYSAFARKGQVAQLRFKASDPLIERPLLSEGSAWVIRRILSGQARPDRDQRAALVQRNVLAWKTGTSYGFRDAWAIGIGEQYLIGIWVGRPDGTPVAGQVGIISATPLLLQVHDIVTLRGERVKYSALVADEKPASVGVAAVCWPSGQPLAATNPNCRKHRFAWTVNDLTPPTLQAADQPLGTGLTQTIWINSKGLQVAADCPDAKRIKVDLWPAPLEPWLLRVERRSRRLPAIDPNCAPLLQPKSSPLFIVGIREGDQLQLPAISSEPITLTLSSLGGSGKRWWFLNGRLIKETSAEDSFTQTFIKKGKQQLSLLDEAGQTATLDFSVQ